MRFAKSVCCKKQSVSKLFLARTVCTVLLGFKFILLTTSLGIKLIGIQQSGKNTIGFERFRILASSFKKVATISTGSDLFLLFSCGIYFTCFFLNLFLLFFNFFFYSILFFFYLFLLFLNFFLYFILFFFYFFLLLYYPFFNFY